MKNILIVFALAHFAASLAHAQDVIKCVTDTGVSYQMQGCDEGKGTILGAKLGSAAGANSASWVPLEPGAKTPAPRQSAANTELRVGMSDMQILNNRFWGKPQRISRNREPRAWHEYWRYESGTNTGKRLHFINSKLAEITDLEPITESTTLSSTMVSTR